MHRVFNRGSKEFDNGGRFYGPYYQGMPSKFRKNIYIDGKKQLSGIIPVCTSACFTTNSALSLTKTRMPSAMVPNVMNINWSVPDQHQCQKRGSHIAVRDALQNAGFDAAQDLIQIRQMMDDFKARHAPFKSSCSRVLDRPSKR